MIKEFKLGGIKFRVKKSNKRLYDLSLSGLAEHAKALISINKKGCNKNYVEQTFSHELVHAILICLGENDLSANEKFVQGFAVLLHQFEKTKR